MYAGFARTRANVSHPAATCTSEATLTAAPTISAGRPLATVELEAVRSLYDRGLYLQALRAAESIAPLRSWQGTDAQLLAGRLAANLGAPRLARALHHVAWRSAPDHPEAIYFYARSILDRRGLLEAWRVQERFGDLPDAPAAVCADFRAFRAHTYGQLRDFDQAEAWLARAAEAAPDRPWILIERATLYELEDRYDDAVAASLRAIELRPWYRPGVQSAAHTLGLVGRDHDALALLTDACRRLESAALQLQLGALQIELGFYRDAADSLERAAELSPLGERACLQGLNAMRSRAAYFAGDSAASLEFARKSESPYHAKIIERLESGFGEDKSVLLPVGFVRQHFATCAPATLAALSRYWNEPLDHLGLAEQICYDGTPHQSQRAWIEARGWVAREFTVTWDDVVALLDRRVPFTLTSVAVARSHLQAVIGYDGRRGVMLIRDPYFRHVGEALGPEWLADQAFSGPRGMAMIPASRAAVLDDVALTDSRAYDRYHALQSALVAHDRAAAVREYDALASADPGHRLALEARLSLAAYDQDETTRLECLDRLLAIYPDAPVLLAARIACLGALGRREDRLEMLRQRCARRDADPIFSQQYADELIDDARRHAEARGLLERFVRMHPDAGGGYYSLGRLFWRQRDFPAGLCMYRFAACLDDRNESFALTYFAAARHLGRTDEALACLRSRFDRFKARSSQPARTLFSALEQLARITDAFAVLDDAVAARPEDGDLLLFAAQQSQRCGRLETHAGLLERARTRCQRTQWLRAAADVARMRGDLAAAADHWREILAVEPLAIDVHANLARALLATKGRDAALHHIRHTAELHPHHYGLHQLWIEWLRDEDQPEHERVVRRLVELHPADAWARRELALLLKHAHRLDEARGEAALAIELVPTQPANHLVLAQIERVAGRVDAARAAAREAIRLAVDAEGAVSLLFDLARDAAESRAAAEFVCEQLHVQAIYGDGLLAWRALASAVLDSEAMTSQLRRFVGERPDLWQTWIALAQQLRCDRRLSDARASAAETVERFPMVVGPLEELASVEEALGNVDAALAALQAALDCQPDSHAIVLALAGLCTRAKRHDRAAAVLRDALARDPGNAVTHAALAESLWARAEHAEAIRQMKQALTLEPGLVQGWDDLRRWCAECGQSTVAADFARELASSRGDEARTWLIIATTLDQPSDLDERLAALDKALEFEPTLAEAWDLRAELLTGSGRFDEALAACRPPKLDSRPVTLVGREAWILSVQSRTADAIRVMREALRLDPRYHWGWQNLLEWLEASGATPALLAAADEFVAQQPGAALAHAWRAHARRAGHDAVGARADLERVLALSPGDAAAAAGLFDVCLELLDYHAAGKALDSLPAGGNEAALLEMRIRLAARRGSRDDATAAFKRLCEAQGDIAAALSAAIAELTKAKLLADAVRILDAAVERETVDAAVAETFGSCAATAMPRDQFTRRLDVLLSRGPIGMEVAAGYISGLADAKRTGDLRRFISKRRRELAAHVRTWSAVAWCWVDSTNSWKNGRWARQWRKFEDARPRDLIPAAIVFHRAGNHAEALEVSCRAAEFADDGSRWVHLLLIALEAAIHGDPRTARHHLRSVPVGRLDAFYGSLCDWASATAVAWDANVPRGERFRRARGLLANGRARMGHLAHNRLHRRLYLRSVRSVGRGVGGVTAWCWAVLRCLAT